MPSLLITGVNVGTDELTIVAHGLNTGDGPAAVRTAGGTLPAPLAQVTDYWAIKTGANTVKLATSSANAMANVWIDITTTGAGTNTLEIGIPYERARTYVAGSQVKSADLDAIQDSLQALHRLNTGQAQTIWSKYLPSTLHVSAFGGLIDSGWVGDDAGYLRSTGAGEVRFGLPLRPGDVVTGVTFELWGNGAANLTGEISKRPLASAKTPLNGISVLATPAAWTDIVNTLTPFTAAEGDEIFVLLNASAAGLRIGPMRVHRFLTS